MFFEKFSAIRDAVARIIGETPKVVTAFLPGKLGVVDGTEEQLGFGTVEKGTAVLNVGDLFYGHATMPMHGKVGGTIDLLAVPAKAFLILFISWSVGDEGFGLESFNDISKELIEIVFGIGTDRLHL